MSHSGLILKLSCNDRPGIVAKVANYVAGHCGNLVEFAQFSDQLGGKFFARLEIVTADMDVDVQDFIDGFGTLGRSLQADWHFRRLPYRMKTAVLVTKTDHCLNEILWRAELDELPIEITSLGSVRALRQMRVDAGAEKTEKQAWRGRWDSSIRERCIT